MRRGKKHLGPPGPEEETMIMNVTEAKPYWKCSKCGYILTEPKPPEVCPECKKACEFKDVSCYLPECGGVGNIDPRL
jgi:rubredoxin